MIQNQFPESILITEEKPLSNEALATSHTSRQIRLSKVLHMVENAGTEVLYRCINCRNCNECRNSGKIGCISIQEEFEQHFIEEGVHVDIEKGITLAKLPFILNPEYKLNPNRSKALKVFDGQIRKLKKKKDKDEVIDSERRVRDMGFVDFLENLSATHQTMSKIQYFIPWRAVWNTNSLSTPCRLVFDASLATNSGFSLNSILAKGRSNVNKLVEILVRWLMHKFTDHTDIQKMYSTIRLVEEEWCY